MKAADPVTVDLYRLAYNAGRPLTFDELVDGMPSAYQNDANRWWVAKQQADGWDIPEEPWSNSQQRLVKAEWIAHQVRVSCQTKRLSVTRKDGGSVRNASRIPHSEKLYSANKQNPPMVLEEAFVQRVVPWTPEIGSTGRRHVAGIKFRDEMARIDALGSKVTKHDLEQALTLAMEALNVTLHGEGGQ